VIELLEYQVENFRIRRDFQCLIFSADMMNIKIISLNSALLATDLSKATIPNADTAATQLRYHKISLKSTWNLKATQNLMHNRKIPLILKNENS
jgi:hypothetical protein